MSRNYILRTKIFRPVESREAYTLRSLERAFPTGSWVEAPQEGEAEVAEVPGCDPGGRGFESLTPLSRPTYPKPPGAELPDGTPADPSDPKLKHAVQRTGLRAVLFARKADATKFAATLVREAKERGAEVAGNANLGWRVYPLVEEPWGMGVFSRLLKGK